MPSVCLSDMFIIINGEASEVWDGCGSCIHQRESLALGVTFEASSAMLHPHTLHFCQTKYLGINMSLEHHVLMTVGIWG